MAIQTLDIHNVRNIRSARIEPAAGINLVTGLNASGKTSLLEALFVLGRGNSFRTHHISQVINKGAEALTVFAKLAEDGGTLGIERARNQNPRIRISGRKVDRLAELVAKLPVLAISPNSHRIIESGPKERRQFLDWGVFHVEQGYYKTWTQFTHSLRQRNAGLRKRLDADQDRYWRKDIVEGSHKISAMRRSYLSKLEPLFQTLVDEILGLTDIRLTYFQGWRAETELAEQIEAGLDRDYAQGYTRLGAQRADIRIDYQDQPAQQVLSRGQQKLVVCALRLAQAMVLTENTGDRCLILVDDLPAELDVNRRELLMHTLCTMPGQVFVTATSGKLLPLESGMTHGVFHVEQGEIKDLSK